MLIVLCSQDKKIKIQTLQASNDISLYIKKHNIQNTTAMRNTQLIQ